MNQIYFMFIVRLEAVIPPVPRSPEALDAKWLPEHVFPLADIWEPMRHFDMSEMFERVRAGRFEFYQRTDDFNRVISEHGSVRYLRIGRAKT